MIYKPAWIETVYEWWHVLMCVFGGVMLTMSAAIMFKVLFFCLFGYYPY